MSIYTGFQKFGGQFKLFFFRPFFLFWKKYKKNINFFTKDFYFE